MDTRYIIATIIWAIVCAGTTHGQNDTSVEAGVVQPFVFQDNSIQENISTIETTQELHHTVTMLLNTTEFISTTTTAQTKNISFTTDMPITTTSMTSKKTENCMVPRKDNFIACFEGLGNNAVKYMASKNLTGFLDDICDANRSKPYMECIKEHFQECPDFLNRIEVQVLQFGPYHIKDIVYFRSIDQMCSCSTGLVCIQELLKVKQNQKLTSLVPNSPWLNLPNYKVLCENDTSRYIGCVRKNLRQCQSPLTKRYGDDFTNDDAEDIKRMYEFTKDHCDVINEDDFSEKYKCIEEKSTSEEYRECIHSTENLPNARKICRIRDCVKEILEDACDSDELIPLYIDAVNIYRRDSVRLLNKQCTLSSAPEIGLSIAAVFIAFFIVVFV